MTRCYLDTNFLYAHLRTDHGTSSDLDDWRARALAHLETDGGVISALVLDEIAYRLVLAWLRDDGDRDPLSTYRKQAREVMVAMQERLELTWQAIDGLGLELHPTDSAVVTRAKSLMGEPGLAPRDAFHAAHALEAGCAIVVSSDDGFDDTPNLRRLGPQTP